MLGTPLAASASYVDKLKEKEARKAALKQAAEKMKRSGEDKSEGVFKPSEYSLSEEARTPNVHSRQNEGARTQENV